MLTTKIAKSRQQLNIGQNCFTRCTRLLLVTFMRIIMGEKKFAEQKIARKRVTFGVKFSLLLCVLIGAIKKLRI